LIIVSHGWVHVKRFLIFFRGIAVSRLPVAARIFSS